MEHLVNFIADCGEEFANDVLRETNKKFGIETSTTTGESPFSNGAIESNKKVLYETLMKTMEDAKCDFSMGSSSKKCIAESWWIFSKPVSI